MLDDIDEMSGTLCTAFCLYGLRSACRGLVNTPQQQPITDDRVNFRCSNTGWRRTQKGPRLPGLHPTKRGIVLELFSEKSKRRKINLNLHSTRRRHQHAAAGRLAFDCQIPASTFPQKLAEHIAMLEHQNAQQQAVQRLAVHPPLQHAASWCSIMLPAPTPTLHSSNSPHNLQQTMHQQNSSSIGGPSIPEAAPQSPAPAHALPQTPG